MDTTERNWAVMCHLSALVMFLGVPFGNILGPLIVWLIKRGSSTMVDMNGRESLNFQISLTLYVVLLCVVTIVLCFVLIGFLLIPLLVAVFAVGPFVDLIFVIVAAVKVGDGEFYRYPATIRFF